jgi:hypothetical protein
LPLLDWTEKNRTVTDPFIAHALMVATFRVALTEAVRMTPSTRIERFERESRDLTAGWRVASHEVPELCRDLRTHRDPERLFVNPDAFFVLHDGARAEGDQRSAFFVEADRSTMTVGRLLEKFVHYAEMYRARVHHRRPFEVPAFFVLTVTKTAERASNLLMVVTADGSPVPPASRDFFLFTTEEAYREHPTNVLAAIWRAANHPGERRSIIPSPVPRAGVAS